MKNWIKKMSLRNTIIIIVVAILLLSGGIVYAYNRISTSFSGNIQIVTMSGGGTGGTTAPNPSDIEVLNVLNFTEVPTNSNTPLTGDVVLRNNTGSDLYFISCNGTPKYPTLGYIETSTTVTTFYNGSTQNITIDYYPAGNEMPLGDFPYRVDVFYSY